MKKYLPYVLVAVLATAGGFGGGMTYAKSKRAMVGGARGANGTFAATFNGQAGGAVGANGARGGFRGAAVGGATGTANFVMGDVLSKDAQGITVKLRDGGSKVVFISGSTTVSKPTDIKMDDLVVGDSVVVQGKANDDGSVTAESIQVRSGMPMIMPGGNPPPDAAKK